MEMYPQDNELKDGKTTPEDYDNISGNRGDVILTENVFVPVRSTITSAEKPVVYHGVGFEIDTLNDKVFPILKASPTTYASNSTVESFGGDINLVAGYQSEYNQRFTFSGSLAMCSDEFITFSTPLNKDYRVSPNFKMCADLLDWTFGKKGVLRATNIVHHLNSPALISKGQKPQDYKENDDVFFSIDIEELQGDEWMPYDCSDVQLEYVMIHPFWRIKMDRKGKTFSATFKTPDQNGAFKFKIDHLRYGFTRVHIEEVAPNRIL